MKWFVEFESADKTYWHRFHISYENFKEAEKAADNFKKHMLKHEILITTKIVSSEHVLAEKAARRVYV